MKWTSVVCSCTAIFLLSWVRKPWFPLGTSPARVVLERLGSEGDLPSFGHQHTYHLAQVRQISLSFPGVWILSGVTQTGICVKLTRGSYLQRLSIRSCYPDPQSCLHPFPSWSLTVQHFLWLSELPRIFPITFFLKLVSSYCLHPKNSNWHTEFIR